MGVKAIWLLCVLLILGTLTACDPSHSLAVRNRSDTEWLVRVTEDYGQSVFVVPPLSYEDTFEPAIGPMQGTVELLRVDCSVVEELPLQTGVMEITATGHASIRYFMNGDTEFPTALFEETTRCGGSQLRPPGTTPQP